MNNSQIFDPIPPIISKCGNYVAMPHNKKWVALVDGKQEKWFTDMNKAKQYIDKISKASRKTGSKASPLA